MRTPALAERQDTSARADTDLEKSKGGAEWILLLAETLNGLLRQYSCQLDVEGGRGVTA